MRGPVDDLVAMFNRRSDDFGLLAVTPDVISGHQEVANVFAHIGVLDGPTNVAPFWDASFTPIIQSA
jgi:sulfonate transport system substrate-binding protein